MRLKEMSATKQAGGKGETEKGKQPAAQKKMARTLPRYSTQTQPLLFADGAFVAALGVVPNEAWCRTWAATRTIMLRMTSKRVNEVLDQMILPAVVRLSRRFWDDARNGTKRAKQLEFVLRQLAAMTARCLITTLELRNIEMKGQDTGVLAQCPALAHLDLSDLCGFGTAEAERLEGALGQCRELVYLNYLGNKRPAGGAVLAGVPTICPALVHLYLTGNRIGDIGAGRLAEVLKQCEALVTLDLGRNEVGAAGAERLAGGLAQCTTLTYLGLGNNSIGPAGTESLARVLGQCKSLSRLHLLRNEIGPAGAGSLARVLPQCAALAHLNIWRNGIGDAGARMLEGVLAQCTVLAILDVSLNEIHTHEAERLRASWRGEAWCLRL